MGNEGIEYIFLTYANFSPDEGVQEFIKDFIYKISLSFRLPNEIRKHLESIKIELSNFEDYQDKYKAKKHLEEILEKSEQSRSKLTLPILKDLFQLVYGPSEGSCFGICPYGGLAKRIIIPNVFAEYQDLKCLHCNQLCFKHFLNEIINGKEYSEVIGLTQFLLQGRNMVFNGFVVEPSPFNSYFKEELKPTLLWNTTILILSLSLFIDMVVSYRVGEFLLNNDRRKLIVCLRCENYAIARNLNQKYCSLCSKKGIKSKEQRNEAQRRWRAKKKEQEYEERIKNLVNQTGIPFDEVKKIVDSDSKRKKR